jgi:hypothetical protein
LLNGVAPWSVTTKAISLVLSISGPLPAGSGTPIRITRSWRYSIYRSSDGYWYLGARDWNASTRKFNTIQPVSGPFVSPGGGGVAFRYFDTTGATIASGSATPRAIALIQVSFRVDSALPGTFHHAIAVSAIATMKVALRNRLK